MNFSKINNSILTISFFSFLISIGYIIYIEFIKDDRPKLYFDIQSVVNVFDITNKLDDLKVLYQNIDILKENKKLFIVNVKIHNKGTTSILLEDYDTEFPIGFSLNNSNILSVNVIESSSEYFSQKLLKITSDLNKVILPNIIIDPDNYLILSLIVLKDEESEITINPFGKIAKINNFLVENTYKNVEYTFWNDLNEGNIFIKFSRLIYYFFLFLMIFLTIIFIIAIPFIVVDTIKELVSKYSRQNQIKKYLKFMPYNNSPSDELIVNLYEKEGSQFIEDLKEFFNNDYQKILTDYQEVKSLDDIKKEQSKNIDTEKLKLEEDIKYKNYYKINRLISKKILDDSGKINDDVKNAFNNFREYLFKES